MTIIEKLEALARWRNRSFDYKYTVARAIAARETTLSGARSDTHTFARTMTYLLNDVMSPEEYSYEAPE